MYAKIKQIKIYYDTYYLAYKKSYLVYIYNNNIIIMIYVIISINKLYL